MHFIKKKMILDNFQAWRSPKTAEKQANLHPRK